MERWGLGYDTLSEINPRLIMIRVSGYGQSGPFASKAGYGSIGEAMGGMRNLAGDPSTPPSRIGLSIGDSLAATYATLGALMALHHREKTGKGQVVDSAIYEAVLAMTESVAAEYSYNGFNRERTGSILPKVAPSNAYPTRDGDILIGANQDTVWRRLAVAMGRPELGEDPRYATHKERGERQEELDNLIADWTRGKSAEEVLALMDEHAIPAGKIFKAEDMFKDPQYAAREALVTMEHPEFGKLSMQNTFPKLSGTPGRVNWAGPGELGQHNEDIYSGMLGLGKDELDRLKADGII
jgi:crotonobetainyl-CoA:carnitine CoA-transferase CaiB-like acyl-CoA transferase